MAKLNKGFKAKWLTALRSGKYEQGTAALVNKRHSVTEYCCLGVAGSISGICDSKLQRMGCPSALDSDAGGYLNTKTAGRLGLTNAMQIKLSQLNDRNAVTDCGNGKPFATVIRYISRNL